MTLCTYESATFEWQPNERKPIVHNFWLMTHRNIPIVCLLPCSFDSLLSYICSNGGGRLRGGVDQFLDMFTKKTTLLTLRRRRCVAIFKIWILHYALRWDLMCCVVCSWLEAASFNWLSQTNFVSKRPRRTKPVRIILVCFVRCAYTSAIESIWCSHSEKAFFGLYSLRCVNAQIWKRRLKTHVK